MKGLSKDKLIMYCSIVASVRLEALKKTTNNILACGAHVYCALKIIFH